MQWERGKRNYQEHEAARFFIYLSFRIAFLSENVNQETSGSLPMWVVTTAVALGEQSTRRSQMFCKINALKNLAIFPGKHLCWRFFLINLIKNRLQHSCFPVNIPKCLSTAFYIKHFVPIHYTFQNFYVMIKFFRFFGYKIDIFHIPCALFSFITLVLESEVHCYFVFILLFYQNSY